MNNSSWLKILCWRVHVPSAQKSTKHRTWWMKYGKWLKTVGIMIQYKDLFTANVSETLEILRSSAKLLPGERYTTYAPTSETAPSQPNSNATLWDVKYTDSDTSIRTAVLYFWVTPHYPTPRIEEGNSMPPVPVNPPLTSHPQSAFGAHFTLPGLAYHRRIHLLLLSRVNCVAQSLRDLTLAMGHPTGDLTIWDIEKGLLLRTYTVTGRSPVTCVAFQPNANLNDIEKIIIGTRSGTVMVREHHFDDTLQHAFKMAKKVVCVYLTQNGDIQAIDNEAWVRSKSGDLRQQALENALPKDSWTQCLFSSDGNTAWVGFPDGDIVSVNLHAGQHRITFMSAKASSGRASHSSPSQISPSCCTNIILSPMEDKLATCYASGEIHIWDINTGGNQVLHLQTFASRANRNPLHSPLCFSHRGPCIVIPSLEKEKTLVVQNVESGELLYEIPLSVCPDGSISYIAISPDDQYITMIIEDSSISIFSQTSWRVHWVCSPSLRISIIVFTAALYLFIDCYLYRCLT